MADISTADLLLVAEDLEYLGEWGSDISNREIRHGSATLRWLIVEGAYGQAWRAVGLERRELELIAVDFDAVFPVGMQQNLLVGLSGGALFRGVHSDCVAMEKGRHPTIAGRNLPQPIRDDGYFGERHRRALAIVRFRPTPAIRDSSGFVRDKRRSGLLRALSCRQTVQ